MLMRVFACQAPRGSSMPDFMMSPFDRTKGKLQSIAAHEPGEVTGRIILPVSGWSAVWRGLFGGCPRCGEARLFMRFLKPIPYCPHCGQNWSHQQADDFPAYVSIFVTGHLLAPVIIGLTQHGNLSTTALLSIIMPIAIILMIGLLQPAKGGIIALQWWFGIHGFEKERAEPFIDEAEE